MSFSCIKLPIFIDLSVHMSHLRNSVMWIGGNVRKSTLFCRILSCQSVCFEF